MQFKSHTATDSHRMCNYFPPSQFTGVFYYFFLDYHRFWWAPGGYVVLLFVFATLWLLCTEFVTAVRASDTLNLL